MLACVYGRRPHVHNAYGHPAAGTQVMAAYGLIDDRAAAAAAIDPSVLGGGENETTAAKQLQDNRRNVGLWWSFVGGSFAGLCQAAVIIPTDNVKVKLQVKPHNNMDNELSLCTVVVHCQYGEIARAP